MPQLIYLSRPAEKTRDEHVVRRLFVDLEAFSNTLLATASAYRPRMVVFGEEL
jgi:hypothetical protein